MSYKASSDPEAAAVEAFARFQLEREISARERIARASGFALLELTSILDEPEAVLAGGVDPLGIVLVGFTVRGRRLLRSMYRLLDAGEASEAVPLLRTISEYLIVGRWLSEHPDRLGDWAMADHDRRDYVIAEVMRELGDEDPETTAALQRQRDEIELSRKHWVGERGQPGSAPNVEQMATQLGLGFAYQLAYRSQSQFDVHATTLAVDSCYDQLPSGELGIRRTPVHALAEFNQYELGAHTLRDLLATTNAHVRSFLWTTGLDAITGALEALRESDPRKYTDPAVGSFAPLNLNRMKRRQNLATSAL